MILYEMLVGKVLFQKVSVFYDIILDLLRPQKLMASL